MSSSLDELRKYRSGGTAEPAPVSAPASAPVRSPTTSGSSLDQLRKLRGVTPPAERDATTATPTQPTSPTISRRRIRRGPEIGTVAEGYQFIGGDASESGNWEKVQEGAGEPWENYEEGSGFDQGFATSEMPDSDIEGIAKLRGVDPEFLKALAPMAGGKRGGEQDILAMIGRGPGLSIPNWVAKKFGEDDPKVRAAFDDLMRIADNRRSWAQSIAEGVVGFGGLGLIGRAAGKKLGGKLATEIGKEGFQRGAVEGAALGGLEGLGTSREGEELSSATLGAVLGTGLGGTLGHIFRKRVRMTADEAKAVAAGIVDDTEISKEIQDLTSDYITNRTDTLMDTLTTPIEGLPKADREIRKAQIKDFGNFLADKEGVDYKEAKKLIKEKLLDGDEHFQREVENYLSLVATRDVLNKAASKAPPEMQKTWRAVRYTISDARYIYKELDEIHPDLDLRLEPLVDQMSNQYDKMTWVLSGAQKRFAKLNRSLRKEGIKADDAYQSLEEGKAVGSMVGHDDVLKAWQDEFEILRTTANKFMGGEVIKKESNYVRRIAMSPERVMVKIMQEAKREGVDPNKAISADQFGKLVVKVTGEDGKPAVVKAPLVRMLEYATDIKVETAQDLVNALQAVKDPRIMRAKYTSKAGTLFPRAEEGGIPPELLETDLRRAYQNWINTTFKHVFLRDSLADLRVASQKLAASGDVKAAEYLRKHIAYLNGTDKGWWTKRIPQAMAMEYKKFVGMKAAEAKTARAKWAWETAEVLPDFLSKTRSTMYQNFLSTPKAAIRNLSQPWVLSAPELFSGDPRQMMWGYKKVIGGYKELFRNWKGSVEELKARGHLSDRFVGEGLDHLKKGMHDSKVFRGASGLIDKAAETALIAYQGSDTINRVVTMHMAKQVSNDLLNGHKGAISYVNNLGRGYRKQIQGLLQERARLEEIVGKMGGEVSEKVGKRLDDVDARIETAIIDQLVSATQFRYNGTALAQYGRDIGPMMAVFTKWPLSVSADIINRFQTKGVAQGTMQSATKYLGPYVGLLTLDAMLLNHAAPDWIQDRMPEALQTDKIFDPSSDRYKTTVGRGGFRSWAPPASAIDIVLEPTRAVKPPAVGLAMAGFDDVSKTLERGDAEYMTGFLSEAIYQTVPMMGHVRFITDDLVTLISGEKPEGRTFLERTVEGGRRLPEELGRVGGSIRDKIKGEGEK